MKPEPLFLLQVAMYAAFPVAFGALRPAVRLGLAYTYVGVVLVVGGVLGAVYLLPVTDDIAMSGGSIAYGALLLTTVTLILMDRDLEVVRTIIRIVVAVNIFKLGLYATTSWALRSDQVIHPNEVSPEVFSSSVRVVVVGGLLIIAELILLVAVYARVNASVTDQNAVNALYIATFVAVVTLDGALFPVLAFTTEPDLGDAIWRGMQSKLLLGLAFSVPLALFLALYRSRISAHGGMPFRVQELFFAGEGDLRRELERQHEELRATERAYSDQVDRLDRHAALVGSIATVDGAVPADEVLGALADVLCSLPGVLPERLALGVVVGGHEVDAFGRAVQSGAVAEGLEGAWFESHGRRGIVRVPLTDKGEVMGMLDVPAEARPGELITILDRATPELTATLRPVLAETRKMWSDQSPIRAVLAERSLDPVFQPIAGLDDRRVVGYEGLSRFRANASSEAVFRRAHALGLAQELELLAIEILLEAAEAFPHGLSLSVNVSPETVFAPGLAPLLTGSGRPVMLEITEHDPIDDYEGLIDRVRSIPGVGLVVDDAGSGYASLRHILELQPDQVKLDREWVRGIADDRARQALVRGLAGFADEVGTVLIAEGIQSEEEAEVLRGLGVRFGQGFLFARPSPVESFTGA